MRGLTPQQYTQYLIIMAGITLGLLVTVIRWWKTRDRPKLDEDRAPKLEDRPKIGPDQKPKQPEVPTPNPLFEKLKTRVEDLKKSVKKEIEKTKQELHSSDQITTPISAWFGVLVNDLKTIHLIILGSTGQGKTTLARSLIAERVRSGHQVVVVDPDSALDTWWDLNVWGAGDQWDVIDKVFQFLLTELKERGKARSQLPEEKAIFQPVTIIVDEVPALQAECPTWKPFFEKMGTRGRKRNLHLIILTQSNRVGTLGIEGRGDLRENFTMIDLDNKILSTPRDPRVGIEFDLKSVREISSFRPDEEDEYPIDLRDEGEVEKEDEEPDQVLLPTRSPQHHPGMMGGDDEGGVTPADMEIDTPISTGMMVRVETRDWAKRDAIEFLLHHTNLSQSRILQWFKGDPNTLTAWVKETREEEVPS